MPGVKEVVYLGVGVAVVGGLAYLLWKAAGPKAGFKDLWITKYRSQSPGGTIIEGPPGALLPINDGFSYSATMEFKHKGPGGVYKCHMAIDCEGQYNVAASEPIDIPYDSDWTTYTVECRSGTAVFNRHGLDHCRRLDCRKIIYDEEGNVALDDTDTASYHIVQYGEVDRIWVDEYWSQIGDEIFAGKPGSVLPIVEGAKFGARVKISHRYLGGDYRVDVGIHIGGGEYEVAAGSITLPLSLDRTEYTVEVTSDAGTGNFRNRTGLGHCRRLDTHYVLYEGTKVHKADDDAECYHLVAIAEAKKLIVTRYFSDLGDGSPGARVPVSQGNDWGADVEFEYRYLGGNWTVLVEAKVGGGELIRTYKDFSLPFVLNYTKVKVTTHTYQYGGWDSKGLGHCRLVDVKKTLFWRGAGSDWSQWIPHIEDWDSECYHVIAMTEVDTKSLVANYYWSDRGQGPPGSRVPIAPGNDFGAEIKFRYRYQGENFTILSELNVAGDMERSFVDFTVPFAPDWTTVTVKTATHHEPLFDPRSLGVCRLIDVKNTLIHRGWDWSQWTPLIEDWDSDCFHRVA